MHVALPIRRQAELVSGQVHVKYVRGGARVAVQSLLARGHSD